MSIKTLLIPPLNRPAKRSRMPEFAQGSTIPRIIHQTFYERTLSPELQANVDRLRALNPGWEYRFYDDADIAAFIRENYPPLIWAYYQRIDSRYGAARADLFRYLLMYKVGGVYLDIKSTAMRPLDTVLCPDDRFILSKWHLPDGEYEHRDWSTTCATSRAASTSNGTSSARPAILSCAPCSTRSWRTSTPTTPICTRSASAACCA